MDLRFFNQVISSTGLATGVASGVGAALALGGIIVPVVGWTVLGVGLSVVATKVIINYTINESSKK